MNKRIQPIDVKIYTPDSWLRSPAKLMDNMMKDLWASRELAWRLAVRDISAQYRQTALGLLWAFIIPVTNAIVWVFLNASGIVAISNTALPYPVFVFTGTILFAIFMESVNAPLQQTTAAKPMLAKINFPREALIISGIYQVVFNAGIKVAVLLPVIMMYGIIPDWNLLLFPLSVVSLILAGTALGMLLTPVGMLYTDVGKSIPLLLQFLMYLTPVVFAMPTSGRAATVFQLNPLTPLILTARDWLTGGPADMVGHFFIVNSVVVVLLLVLWVVYRAAMPILIERMSA